MADIASLGIRVSTQGVTQAKTELEGLSQSSRTAAAAAKEAGASWEKNTFSPTRLYAANKALADYKKGLQDAAAAAAAVGTKGARGLSQAAKSAKELQFATRNLPAQFTDIFTSLQSGQRPMQVLLQQGGQIKDMFGGVGPAIRAMGSYVLGLINPFTVAAAAVVGLGLAWKSAADETQAFNMAIIRSGNYARLSADDLDELARKLDDTTEATQRFAGDVLTQVVSTGRFTGEQVDIVSTAIVNMSKAVQAAGGDADEAIKELIKSFSDLSRDPVDALLKLNETQHFLTTETLEQVKSLKEQGKGADATSVAVRALADAVNDGATKMQDNLGATSIMFSALRNGAAEALDTIVEKFRNADKAVLDFLRSGSFVARTFGNLITVGGLIPADFGSAQRSSGRGSSIPKTPLDGAFSVPGQNQFSAVPFSATAGGGGAIVDSKAAQQAIKDAEDAQREWNSAIRQGETDAARLKRELNEVAEAGKRLKKTPEEIKALQDQVRASFARKKPKGPADGIEAASSRAAIKALEDQLKKEQGLLANQAQILQANYSARNITAQHYYAEQKRLAQENQAVQERALEGEIAALKSRSLKGKDSINNAAELAEKEALLAKVRADGAAKLEVLNIQEAAQLKQRQQANIAYADALNSGKEALQAELDSQVLRIKVGEREFEIRSRITQLYRDEAKELLNLARQRDAGDIDPETYKQRVEQLRSSIAEQVRIVKDGYAAMSEAQQNWANGALKAFADYRDAANDVAGQTYGIFTDALHGLEDVFVDFFTKGKADWKGFFDSIAAEITRFIVRQQLAKLAAKFLPGGDEKGDSAAAISGAAASLAASAAPLYGAAAALSASAAALAAAGAGGAASGGASGTSGGFNWGSLFSTALSAWGGGRAHGGPVVANRLYEVGENNKPELLQMHGRSYLIPGNQGNVVPLSGGSAPRNMTMNQTFVVQGAPDRRTREQMARESGRAARREMARTGS